MLRAAFALGSLLLLSPGARGQAGADGSVPPPGLFTEPPMHLAFDAYAAGLNVIRLNVAVELSQHGYRVDVAYHTTGLFGAVISAQTDTWVTGDWSPEGVAPLRFYSYGTLRGRPRRTLIDYLSGQPQVKILEPPDDDRDPVPANEQRDTIDTLSAMALLVRELARTGHCDGHATTFDGRRLSSIAVHDAGTVVLERDSSSIFTGPAHRCDFEGRQLAGFVHDVDREQLIRPQHGSAWLAAIASGEPLLPVRMSFHTRFFGDATMYLTEANRVGEAIPR